jgi:integrase/recombinase XerD
LPLGLSTNIRHVKSFADFVGCSPDKATTPEDVRRYQLRLASIGTTVPTTNAWASALRFFFKVTLKRNDLAEEVVSVREPRRLPLVLSPEEIGPQAGLDASRPTLAVPRLPWAARE